MDFFDFIICKLKTEYLRLQTLDLAMDLQTKTPILHQLKN